MPVGTAKKVTTTSASAAGRTDGVSRRRSPVSVYWPAGSSRPSIVTLTTVNGVTGRSNSA